MPEYRIIFEKTGRAKWLSHLDVMHIISRAFLRADIPLRHSEGFNPHPRISIAHPLPVGVESLAEVLDFETVCAGPANMPERLNAVLPEGIRVLRAYEPQRPARDIMFALYRLEFIYDAGAPSAAKLCEFFGRDPIPVTKKSKKGETVINLHAAYTSFRAEKTDGNTLRAEIIVDASKAPINPKYFESALRGTDLAPDFVRPCRVMFMDAAGTSFE